jgi:hypothetical protein
MPSRGLPISTAPGAIEGFMDSAARKWTPRHLVC